MKPHHLHTPSAGILLSYSPRQKPIPYPRSVSPSPAAKPPPANFEPSSDTDSDSRGSEETMSNSASDVVLDEPRFNGGIPNPNFRPHSKSNSPGNSNQQSDTSIELQQIFPDESTESDSDASGKGNTVVPLPSEQRAAEPDRGDFIDFDASKDFEFLKYIRGDMHELTNWLRHKPMFPYFPLICLDRVLRSIAQVAFQNNPLCGLFVIAALIGGNPFTGTCVLIGAAISAILMIFLKVSEEESIQGLHGFNGCLVSGAISLFVNGQTPWNPLAMIWIVFGPIACIATEQAVAVAVKQFSIPGFTLPAVLTTYMFLFATYQTPWWNLSNLPNGGFLIVDNNITTELQQISASTLYQGVFNAFSQVWFVESWIAGLFVFLSILFCDIASGISGLLGAVIGLCGGLALGGSEATIRAGLWGYNPVLACISIFPVLFPVHIKSAVYATACAIFCVFLVSAIRSFMTPYGLPALTFGFVLSAQIFYLAAQRIPKLPSRPKKVELKEA